MTYRTEIDAEPPSEISDVIPLGLRVAVLLPCYNEELTVARVVSDFQNALPDAVIYVYDNNSTDSTRQVATKAGAVVRQEPRQGKGYTVRRMFSDIEADIYILADGDATYEAAAAPQLLRVLVADGLDMVCGRRVHTNKDAYRRGHLIGNKALTAMVRLAFGANLKDMLSGYRVFSRRFVKSFPLRSRGFEIETEFTVHALSLEMPLKEIDTEYFERPTGSVSKLSTMRDGFRILVMIFNLLRRERPMVLFGIASIAAFTAAIVLAVPVFAEYARTGLVPRLPTYFTAGALSLVGALSLLSGIILNAIKQVRHEAKLMQYLNIPGVIAALNERVPK